jgi:VWFA-related protein
LTVDDFEVLEDGRPQAITSFAFVNIPIDSAERPPLQPNAIEPDVQTNYRGEGRVYVIALDEVTPTYALRTRLFLRRFIERYFTENDVAAVTFLGRANGRKAQDFTGNRRLLLEAIDSFSGGFPGDPEPASFREPGSSFRARSIMSSLRTLTEFLANIRGQRKVLLLFSHGFPVDMFKVVDYRGGVLPLEEEDAHEAIVAATRGSVTIYPIDPRGLTADGGLGESETATTSLDSTKRLDASTARMDARASLSALAGVTGGFALVDSNNFEDAFDRIVRENSSYYVLGFTSTNERRDGRYRQLQVRVKRGGPQVRARGGYVAPIRQGPAPTPSRPGQLSASASDAIRRPTAVAGVPIEVFGASYKGVKREATVALAIEVIAADFGLVEKGRTLVGQIEVGYFASDTARKIHPGQYHIGTLSLNPERFEVTGGRLRFLSEMRLQPGRYQVRVAAGNRARKAASVVYDMDVPDYSRTGLVMSGVALTSSSASQVTTTRLKDPLANRLPGPITTVREFTSDETLTLLAEVYDNGRGPKTNVLDLVVELRAEDGSVVKSVLEYKSPTDRNGASGGYEFKPTMSLADVPPGSYVIHLEARSNLPEHAPVRRAIPIRVH